MPADRRAATAATLCAFALILAACGGTTGTASVGPAESVAPTATPAASSAAPATDAPPSEGALPSFDLDDLVANLEGVDSYRLVVSSGGTTSYESTVVTKPVLSRDISLEDGTRIVIIGDEAWIGSGDQLQPAPAEMATGMLALFDPILLAGSFATPGALAGADRIGTEEKNGVQATHYRIDSASVVGTLSSMPPGSSIDMWVSADGFLVSLVVVGADEEDFSIDVLDINDPSISIERPG